MGDNKENSSTNKGLVTIIIGLILIIAALVLFILFGKEKKSGDKKVEEEMSTPYQVVEAESTKTDAEEKEKTDEEVKDDIYAEFTFEGDSWGDEPTNNINIAITNKSDKDLSDWEIRIPGFKGAEIQGHWNGTFTLEENSDVLIITSTGEDWNKTVKAGTELQNIGGTIKFRSKEQYEALKNVKPVLYSAGKEIKAEEKAENPKTKETDSVKENEKEKKEVSKKIAPADVSGTPVSNHGALRVDGCDLVDKNGDAYQLKGISTHGIAWFPDFVNKDAFKTLRDEWGANVIRLAMYTAESGGYCTDGDKDKLKGLVDNGVDYATELGMYVIIDWHILSDNDPNQNKDEAIAFFDEMSKKYADYPNVLFEICNEPNGGTQWPQIKKYAEEVIPVIKANKEDAVIIVGTPTWSQDVDIAAEDPIEGYSNIMYTLHFYAATHKDNIRSKLETARSKGLAIFITEFSICDASGNGGVDYDSAKDWFKLIDKYNISYAAWNLANKNETSSLIRSDCSKTSGWNDEELSDTGLWLKKQMNY